MSFCGNCGYKLSENNKFCPSCGAAVEQGESVNSTSAEAKRQKTGVNSVPVSHSGYCCPKCGGTNISSLEDSVNKCYDCGFAFHSRAYFVKNLEFSKALKIINIICIPIGLVVSPVILAPLLESWGADDTMISTIIFLFFIFQIILDCISLSGNIRRIRTWEEELEKFDMAQARFRGKR